MNWFEVIHLRTTTRETEQLVPIIQQLIGEAEEEGFCREIKMYRRALVDTDLSILLYHDALNVESNGSSLGLRMVSALKEFGMVNHTAWFEINSRSPECFRLVGRLNFLHDHHVQ